jgi:hypothetical protein
MGPTRLLAPLGPSSQSGQAPGAAAPCLLHLLTPGVTVQLALLQGGGGAAPEHLAADGGGVVLQDDLVVGVLVAVVQPQVVVHAVLQVLHHTTSPGGVLRCGQACTAPSEGAPRTTQAPSGPAPRGHCRHAWCTMRGLQHGQAGQEVTTVEENDSSHLPSSNNGQDSCPRVMAPTDMTDPSRRSVGGCLVPSALWRKMLRLHWWLEHHVARACTSLVLTHWAHTHGCGEPLAAGTEAEGRCCGASQQLVLL